MRKIIIATLAIFAVISSCSKKDNTCDYDPCALKAPAAEITQLETYLSGAGITATKHCSGMYYQIITPGADKAPGVCSYVSVNYKGMYTDGTVFDQTTTTPYISTLIALIEGWKKGIPLIKKGGKIKLFIPPTLAYGPTPSNGIRANAILVFDVELLDLQ
ncbi:MAG: FKBP-type peptidyl-prolyl cis-trans isomerase [Chitinophagaceae bacterium]